MRRLVTVSSPSSEQRSFARSLVRPPSPHWGGAVVIFSRCMSPLFGYLNRSNLASTRLCNDLLHVTAVIHHLKAAYLASVSAAEGTKMQEYMAMRGPLTLAAYQPAAYLRAVGGWKQRKRLAQLRTGLHYNALPSAGLFLSSVFSSKL